MFYAPILCCEYLLILHLIWSASRDQPELMACLIGFQTIPIIYYTCECWDYLYLLEMVVIREGAAPEPHSYDSQWHMGLDQTHISVILSPDHLKGE